MVAVADCYLCFRFEFLEQMAYMLLGHGVPFNDPLRTGRFALDIALECGSRRIIKELLDRNARAGPFALVYVLRGIPDPPVAASGQPDLQMLLELATTLTLRWLTG